MVLQKSSTAQLNSGLRIFFSEFVRVSLRHPSQALFFARTVLWQAAAARRRAGLAREGLHVPPIAIFSITHRCNLRCKGCYAHAIRGDADDALSTGKLASIVQEAEDLGVTFFIIAGGEPLTRPEIVDICGAHRRMIFILITNGLLLDASLIERLKSQPNTVPTLSIEGTQVETDERRGAGVHERLRGKMAELKEAGIFFSLSLTVTRSNFDIVTDPAFIHDAVDQGCRLFFHMEYTPVQGGTDDWVITDEQRGRMKGLVAQFRSQFKAVFIAVPWDEEEQGGCLAAGRGFVHISAAGDVEPCPFAPFSDANLLTVALRDALASPFLTAMRENHHLFAETSDGCALWKNREAVESLLHHEAVARKDA
jgi:MoaA/NifB/PqqE/SkfB family radical SAM enzyme